MTDLRFIIYGAGAIGGSIGALLWQAGHEVVLIARGAHLSALRSGGLVFTGPDGTATLPIPSVGSPTGLSFRSGDVVIAAMKTQDTASALRELSTVADPATPIVSMQNGVENERIALRLFPNVQGVCVMFPATHLEPGVVSADCAPVPAILDIGAYPTGVDDTTEAVAAAFRSATCRSEPRPDIMAWKYSKLVLNLGNAIQAVCGMADGVGELVGMAREEGRAALAAAEIACVTPEQDAERRGDILRAVPGRRRSGGSSWQSLVRGTGSIEADYLSGEISLLGRMYGVPTPVNTVAQELAGRFAVEGRAPGAISVEEFRALLSKR